MKDDIDGLTVALVILLVVIACGSAAALVIAALDVLVPGAL